MTNFASQIADLLQGGDRLVTQYMDAWDGTMTKDAIMRVAQQEIFDSEGDHRSDGKGRIRPSNLPEECSRFHVLSWLGYPSDVGDRTLMDDGTERHYYWQKVGLSAGFLTDIEVPITNTGLHIKGTADGIMPDGSIFEFKETGPKLYEQRMEARQPTFNHLLQVHAYMGATGTRQASVVYEKRSYKVEWHEFRIDFDPEVYRALENRVWPALDAIEDKKMPPMHGLCEGLSSTKYKNCNFRAVCPSAEFIHPRKEH